MPSTALEDWKTARVLELDQVEEAHRAVGGSGRGRRYATLQVNHAYCMLLASQFQGFCRDLHTECATFLVDNVRPTSIRPVLLAEFTIHRQLDSKNATPSSLGADFGRLGLSFAAELRMHDPQSKNRMKKLEDMNDWRNAIAHQDFGRFGGNRSLQLQTARGWRRACQQLAESFDNVMHEHLRQLVGASPW